ncbi:MAG: UxaA family hydrolase, partial [Cyclobacteriaceae bacterium]|nr:UxaA family hydrolase [Cyclobacteriaceae bacterium HetDA_MAG_MS6]
MSKGIGLTLRLLIVVLHIMEGEGLLKIHPDDNVIVALDDLAAGESSNGYLIKKDLPQKHKFAEQDLAVGDIVRMYGVPIGTTTSPVAVGEPITVKNVVNFTSKYQPWKEKPQWDAPDISAWSSRTFRGYQRADGSVGTRNIWLVFPLVFCENRNIEIIKKSMLSALGYAKQDDQVISIDNLIKAYESDGDLDQVDLSRTSAEDKQSRLFEHVDGLRFLTHQAGCGGTRQDAQVLCELLAGYISNPNVAGATVLSLGCQNAEDRLLLDALQKRGNKKPVFILEQQQSKSEQDFLGEAIKKTFKGLAEANQLARTEVPISKLIVGLECGGSDGFSGISANPSLGHAVDLLVGSGGSAILSEFPELSGVE